ncbi:hypothetical protein BCR39DRAFT_104327 [Naematelia encephala]|uniref:Uncharacterized protein n=1 Tax=Naematelia encephala TaxID=71784 RepID=A0A1Y2B8A3_9TREE|nr:hypothetical protein BCR39DRAFT_104327 [Naematelia encephala]
MRKLHRSPPPHSLSLDDVTQRERKWAVWMTNFKQEERRTARPMLYIYASIRFHWLRLILYHALLDSPTHAASSSAVLARSVSHIIRAYTQAATDDRFLSSWPDLRRITTCGQLVFLLLDAGELVNDEAQELLTMVLELLRGLVTKCPMAEDVEKTITDLMRLSDLTAPRPAPPVELRVSGSASFPNVFDYSVLPAPDQWLCDLSIDSLMSDTYDFAA